jgi:hypothetical protein
MNTNISPAPESTGQEGCELSSNKPLSPESYMVRPDTLLRRAPRVGKATGQMEDAEHGRDATN